MEPGIYLGNVRVANNNTATNGGGGNGTEIDDTAVSDKTTYSSQKTEHRLEEVKNSLIASQEGMVNLWQKTALGVTKGDTISHITSEDNSVDKLVVQCYKFVPGDTNIVQVLKEFNNGDEENFYHSENVEFNGVARIKDVYDLKASLNTDGLYESEEINKSEFATLNRIEVV